MAETRPTNLRIPPDVRGPAMQRAKSEHRTLTDAAVRLLRAYGEGDPAALAIVAGVSPAVLEIHATTTRPARTRGRQANTTSPAEQARDTRESSAGDCPPHPPGRVHKGLCGACGRHVS